MQRVQFDSVVGLLYCPFCGHKTLRARGISPCEHTLYIATDESLEYCSELINKKALLKLKEKEEGWDWATDKLEYDESVKFALYTGGFGAYVGFTALPAE